MGGTMSSITINGDTSGSVILQAPAVAGSTTLTLPSTSGTVLTTTSGQWITTGSDIYYNTGNVGIGITSPASIVHVASSTAPGIGYHLFYGANGDNYYTCGTNGIQVFRSSGTERMRIDSAGACQWNGTYSAGSDRMQYSSGQVLQISKAGTGANNHVQFVNGNGTVGTISTSGTTTTYATSSDYRLKENIIPMVGALDKVSQLKPVTYKWKSDGSDGQGFIAHELQAFLPDAVVGEKDAVDTEGKPIYQGVDTSFLVATLTAAIQELKAELDELKAKIG